MSTRPRCSSVSLWSLAALTVGVLFAQPAALEAGNWQIGDVFAGVAGGCYNVFDNNGNFLEQVCDGLGGYTTGCAFDQAGQGNLYTTNFSNNQIVVYDMNHPHNILCSFATPGDPLFTPPLPSANNESVVFDAAGNLYVGHPDGDEDMHLYDVSTSCPPPGLPVPLASFDVNINGRGTDWLDLAQNQQDMFYTSERDEVRIWDVVANAQGAPDPFALFPVGTVSYALRLLGPACDGFTDGLIVAATGEIRQVDGSGAQIECYDAPGENGWFSFNLDPDGIHFWAGDFGTNNFYKFLINVDGGGCNLPVLGPIASGGILFGLCVKGEMPCGVAITVDIDIKFCSNPNGFNCKQKGKTPVTIFGTADLDVSDIDISSLQLCEDGNLGNCTGAPLDWSVLDRGDPTTDVGAAMCAIDPVTGEELDTLNPDGFDDLDVAFDTQEVVAVIGCDALNRGDSSLTLVLVGQTLGGTPITSIPIGDVGIDQLLIQNN